METGRNIFDSLFSHTKSLAAALGFRDLMTRSHSERVHGLSAEIGLRCGLDEQHLSALRMSASFHDVGKIGIPDHILLKPTPFEDSEWEVMKQHSEIGASILLATELEGAELSAQAIRHHHEWYDGHGYPAGLSGERIPLCSRIISIADSYDAMAITRTYHRAKTHAEIMKILRDETGEKHDPELMRIFMQVIEGSRFRAQ